MDRPGPLTGPGAGGRGRSPAQQELIGAVSSFAAAQLSGPQVCVALSGGADSLALTAAALRAGLQVRALVVDHGLQEGSAQVAHTAAQTARALGAQAEVLPVRVSGDGGPEAAARAARYRALEAACGGRPVLLGHTLDDQAETVLLGLGRGSGARSLAGMARWRAPWGRPLLGVRRARTREACADWGLPVWDDPHNADPRFRRVRVRREALPLLEDVLGGGVAPALARTAGLLRDDADALDALAGDLLAAARSGAGLDATVLAGAPAALRRRALRAWLAEAGAPAAGAATLAALDGLVTGWHGQGPIAVGGDDRARLAVARRARLLVPVRRER